MRRWLSAIALLLLVVLQGAPQAAVSIVDSCYQDGSDADNVESCTLVGVQAGDAIAACGLSFDDDPDPNDQSFSDDRTNSYTEIQSGNGRLVAAYALNVAAGDTVVTLNSGANDFKGIMAVAIRPIPASSAVEDSEVSATTAGGSPVVTPAVSATSNGIVVACMSIISASTITPQNGFTQLEEDESFVNVAGSLVYQLSTASNTYTPSWTVTGTPFDQYAIGIQFKETAAGGLVPCMATLTGTGSC